MTAPQILSFALIGGAIVSFASGRFRYDVVSLVALVAAMVVGVVKPKEAFTGFTSDVVVVIAAALVVSAAIAKSGVVELVLQPVLSRLDRLRTQVPALAAATAALSILTKNVGALAILMPTAIRMGRREGSSVSALLMPMSFMSLLGGLVTLVGTSTNIIVSQVRQNETGHPFGMFDFAPVGLGLTAVGLLVVTVGWRVLPRDRAAAGGIEDVAADAPFATEATVPEDLPERFRTVGDLGLDRLGVELTAVTAPSADGRARRGGAAPDLPLAAGQVLALSGDDEALARVFDSLPLEPVRADDAIEKGEAKEELRALEMVVQPDSVLVGTSARRSRLQERYGVKLLAVARARRRITERLRDFHFRAGDVLLVQAGERALPEFMRDAGLLPLAERRVRFGNPRRRFGPALILLAAIALVAAGVVPVAEAFFGAAVLCVVAGGLSMREAYDALEPEVLVLIGALTPLSEAVEHTGGDALVAHGIAAALTGAPSLIALGTLMIAAMVCSPFLHNAPTVLVLGPIAMSVGRALHLNPDPFLMAVATGAGCDFLTPVGHQCNTLVLGPGGYRFGDYWKLGLPLSVMVILIGVPLIALVWPMTGSG